MEGIFISYRRDDSAGYAGRLYDRLEAHFGADAVFMDVEGIEPGTDFVKAIEGAVASCKVLIVLIGNQWLTATDAAGRRRLDDPNDFIRLETSTALARDIRVVPVLVENASMPLQDDLPDDLHSLVRRQAVELNHKQWESSSGNLINILEKILNVSEERPGTSTKPEQLPARKSRAGGAWIAAVILVIVAAGAAFWQLAPVDGSRVAPPQAPLTSKSEPAESTAPIVAVQAVTPVEDKVKEPKPMIAEIVESAIEEPAAAAPTNMEPGETESTSLSIESPELRPAQSTSPIEQSGIAEETAAAAPVPKPPVAPAVVKKPQPVAPPVITSLTTRVNKTAVSVCYQVEHARILRLAPIPGELKNRVKDCVNVSPEKPTSFTLSATGPGGSASRKITVSPHPDSLAKTERSSKFPTKGERWVYQIRGKWPTSPQRVVQFSIDKVDAGMVTETLTLLEPARKVSGRRTSNAKDPGFVSWPDIGLEFSPWIGAYIELSGNESWEDFAMPSIGNWDKWYSSAVTSKQEHVKVQAGNFEAWKVEAWSNRHATGGSTMAGLEPVRINFVVWYAPQTKRYIKSIRTVQSAGGQVLEEELSELVSYSPN